VALSEPMREHPQRADRPALNPRSRAAYSTTIASDACRKICHTESAQASARSTALRQIADNLRESPHVLEARILGASLGAEPMRAESWPKGRTRAHRAISRTAP